MGSRVEEVSVAEKNLAEDLRTYCTPWGSERESTLYKSSSILLELGRLYIIHMNQRKGMLQKLTVVKCAALITGARTRFEKIQAAEEKVQEARNCFQLMTKVLLAASKARLKDKDLLAVSEKSSIYLNRIREEEKTFIAENLPPFSGNEPESKLQEDYKIKSVRQLLKTNAYGYRQMMQNISKECLETLGDPPCKFSLVGLGSLARDEATLYSDFEHVIVLEDGVDDSPRSEIREYFRWYSVLFHVIIIGLGETFMPTVGVKSLNDLYDEDKTKDWFFDLYTPGGVSFDGRFPHSCKTPLGKQQPSKFKKHIVELIQPISKMVEFLSEEEDLKNGYHLRDVLVRTCFVDGHREVYDEFEKLSISRVIRESRDEEVAEQSKFFVDNIDHMYLNVAENRTLAITDMDKQYNIKNFLYRPLSVLVGCLCRIYRRTSGPNFDFFDWFRESYPSVNLHDLEYSLAVACEMRLKLYSALRHQRQKTPLKYVSEFVGKHSVAKAIRILMSTGVAFRAASIKHPKFDKFLEYLEKGREVASKHDLESTLLMVLGYDSSLDSDSKGIEAAKRCLEMGLADVKNSGSHFRDAEKFLIESGDEAECSQAYCEIMCSIYYFQRSRHSRGYELTTKWTKKYLEGWKPPDPFCFTKMQMLKSVFMMKSMSAEEMVRKAHDELRSCADPMSQIYFKIVLSEGQIMLGKFNDARESMQDAAWTCNSKEVASLTVPETHLSTAQRIFFVQMEKGWIEDAYLMFDLIRMLQSTVRPNFAISATDSENQAASGAIKQSELVVKWAEMQFATGAPSSFFVQQRILEELLLKHGIWNFTEISPFFAKASPFVQNSSTIYSALQDNLMLYCRIIGGESHQQIGQDLLSVCKTFAQHFESLFFLGTFRCLVVYLVKRSVQVKSQIEAVSSKHFNASRLYKIAVDHFQNLNFERSSFFLWKIIHRHKSFGLMKESCSLFLHMVEFSSFVNLLHLLKKQRVSFVERHSFPPYDTNSIEYNRSIKSYMKFDFRSSAKSLWRLLISSKPRSILRSRAIQSLMFVILDVRKCDGYPMLIGNKYVYSQKTREPTPLYADYRCEDLYHALLQNSRETQNALRAAMA